MQQDVKEEILKHLEFCAKYLSELSVQTGDKELALSALRASKNCVRWMDWTCDADNSEIINKIVEKMPPHQCLCNHEED